MKSKDVAKIVDVFAHILEKYPEGVLDMKEPHVNDHHHLCGTVHCHAGWFLIGWYEKQNLPIPPHKGYQSGVSRMLETLKTGKTGLHRFLKTYPEIWGNLLGASYMFFSNKAFTPKHKKQANNLKDVYDHWCEVHDRLWLAEQVGLIN